MPHFMQKSQNQNAIHEYKGLVKFNDKLGKTISRFKQSVQQQKLKIKKTEMETT